MPIFALKRLHVQGLEQSTLGDEARVVGAAHHIVIAGDPEPDRNSFIADGPVQLCAGGGAGAGDEVWMEYGLAGVQGVAGLAGGAVPLDG